MSCKRSFEQEMYEIVTYKRRHTIAEVHNIPFMRHQYHWQTEKLLEKYVPLLRLCDAVQIPRKRMKMLACLFIDINNLKKTGYSLFYRGRVIQNPCVKSQIYGWELQLGNTQWYRYSSNRQSILVNEITSTSLCDVIRSLPLPEDLIPNISQYLTFRFPIHMIHEFESVLSALT